MSRDYINDPSEDQAFSMRSIATSLDRIADTLDDYLGMAMVVQDAAPLLPTDPEGALRLLLDGVAAIRAERGSRSYE